MSPAFLLLLAAGCNRAPTVRVTGVAEAAEGQVVQLQAVVEDDQAAGHELSWDLGDGTRMEHVSAVSHTWKADGLYNVAVAARDPKGLVGQASYSVLVRNVAPTVSGCAAISTREGDVVELAGTVQDPGEDVRTVAWDFGDGATAPGLAARHAWEAAGTYDATLTATDDDGATGSCRATVTVRPFGFKLTEAQLREGFEAFAPAVQRCFHFTGRFRGVAAQGGASVERTLAWVEGTYRMEGLSGTVYDETARVSFEYKDDDSIWVKAEMLDSGALLPPDARCPLLEWTRVGDAQGAVVGHVAERGLDAASTTWDLARLVHAALSDERR